MKARVKGTRKVVDEMSLYIYDQTEGVEYDLSDLEIIDEYPDYWARLEHQYAGMAMQGMSKKFFEDYCDHCAGFGDMDEDEAKATMKDFADTMADVCYCFAHALVEKMRNTNE